MSTPSITVYGIPNCDSVKKTRTWLSYHGVEYAFHDFKKSGIDTATIESWLTQVPLDVLINRKGTTWRKLTDEQKALADQPTTALELMVKNTSVIKRPVVASSQGITVGHNETSLSKLTT